jgi:hypothetical protein
MNEKKSLFVATPCHSSVTIHYHKSMIELCKFSMQNNIDSSFYIIKSSLVTQGRNLCVNAFLDTKAENFLFVDADIEVTPESIKKLLDCEHDVSIIPYTLKNIDWEKLKAQIKVKPNLPLSVLGMGYPIHIEKMQDITCTKGFIEIERGTTGCMMIKRRVFEKMIKEYPQLKIHQESLFNGEMKKHNNLYNFFDTYFDSEKGVYLGEDFYFCELWRNMGGKIHALITDYIVHYGEHGFTGRLLDEVNIHS